MPSSTGPRHARTDLVLVAVVPLLLVAVAVTQLVRAHSIDQSSWHGTGFGMFATYESASNRVVRVLTDDGERLTEADPDAVMRARVVPSDRNLRRVGESAGELAELPSGTPLVVQVWGIDLAEIDGELVLEPELVASTEARAP